jgi:hypothetical protein
MTAKRLRAIYDASGIRLREVTSECGVPSSTASAILTGRLRATPVELTRIERGMFSAIAKRHAALAEILTTEGVTQP